MNYYTVGEHTSSSPEPDVCVQILLLSQEVFFINQWLDGKLPTMGFCYTFFLN